MEPRLSAKQVDKVKTYKRNFNDWLKENGEPLPYCPKKP